MRNDFRDDFVKKVLDGKKEAVLESRILPNGANVDIVVKKDSNNEYKIFLLEKNSSGEYYNEVSNFDITVKGINAAYTKLDSIEEILNRFFQ